MDYETRLRVTSRYGLHARPARILFETLLDIRRKYGVDAEFYDKGVVYDGVLQLLVRGKREGDSLGLRVSGARYMDAVNNFLERASDILIEERS